MTRVPLRSIDMCVLANDGSLNLLIPNLGVNWMKPSRDEMIDILLAEREIRRLGHICSHNVDRGNIEGLRELFHPDAIAEYGFNKTKTVDEFLEHFKVQRTHLTGVQHHMTTHLIAVKGDYAEAENYAIAHCHIEEEDGFKTFVIGGRYLDKYERRNGTWKISHRLGLEDWSVKVPMPPKRSKELVGDIPHGGIGEEDPGHSFFTLL